MRRAYRRDSGQLPAIASYANSCIISIMASVHRRDRHGAILRLIRSQGVSTQAELADALRAAGYDVVQTTVSRDIRELGLVKVRDTTGRLVYAPRGDAVAHDLAPSFRRV
ncbi:MAG TPA: hypothetical protein VNT58_12500, partial [Gaiellaceae bacterium]|nr:hypothetical protein [Gaiellaceae bacterium]